MGDGLDFVVLERHFIPHPPVLHHVLVFEMRDDEGEGYFLLAQKLDEQPIVALHRGSDASASNAKQEEIDATGVMERLDELMGLFDGAEKGVDTHLGLVEPDRIVDAECHISGMAWKGKGILCRFQRATLEVRRSRRDLGAGHQVDDGALPNTSFSEEDHVFAFRNPDYRRVAF